LVKLFEIELGYILDCRCYGEIDVDESWWFRIMEFVDKIVCD
jgi:hypothetical protein